MPKNPARSPGRGWGCVSRRGQPCPVPLRGVADPGQQLLDPPADFGGRQLHVSVLGAAQVAGHETPLGRQGQQLRFPCGTEAGTGQGLRGRGAREWPKNARLQGHGTAASCLPHPHHAARGPAVPPAPPQALASGSCRRCWVLGARCHAGSWWQSPARCLQNPHCSPVLALLAPRAARGTRCARRRRTRRAPRFAPCPDRGWAPCTACAPGWHQEEHRVQALSSCACSTFGCPHAPLCAGTRRGQPGPRRNPHGLAASCSTTAAQSLT